jgi:MFS family permease
MVHAFGFALYVPAWAAIFSRHLDKNRVSFDWSLDSTTAGLAAGASGLLSGIIASVFGFMTVFVAGGILSITAALVLLSMPDLVLPKPNRAESTMKDHTPTSIGV